MDTNPEVASVVSEAHKILDELEKVSAKLNSPVSESLCVKGRSLLRDGSPAARLDVARPEAMETEAIERLAAEIGGGVQAADLAIATQSEEKRVRAFDVFAPPPDLVGVVRSPYLVAALDEKLLAETYLADELAALAERRARVFLVVLRPELTVPAGLVARLRTHAWEVEVRTLADPGTGSTEAVGEASPDQGSTTPPPIMESFEGAGREAHTIAHAYALGTAILRIVDAFSTVVRQAKESQRVKKTELDRDVRRLKDESNLSTRTLLGELDTLLKAEYEEFERGANEAYEEWIGARTGALSALIDEFIESLEHLSERATSKRVTLTIPEEFVADLTDRLRDLLVSRARLDIRALGDVNTIIDQRVRERTAEALGDPVVVSFPDLDTHRYERVLDNLLHLESGFQEQSRKEGLYDYLMVARRPAMMFGMMSMALGGVFAAIGIDREMTGLFVLVLMIIGVAKVIRDVPIQRREDYQEALQKARGALRRDTRRMMEQAVATWLKTLREHIAGIGKVARARLEERIRALEAEHHNRAEDRLQKKQRLLSGVEHTQKLLETAERTDYGRDLSRVVERLDRAFLKVRPEPAGAGGERPRRSRAGAQP